MPKTLLAVGPWRECGKIVASAMANRWSVLYTLFFEDVPTALARMKVDLILLAGCSSRDDWERVAWGAWQVCRDTPVVALGSNSSQDSLVGALVGAVPPDEEGASEHGGAERDGPLSPAHIQQGFRRSEVSPTLSLFEPKAHDARPGISRALDFIERRYAEPITLSDAARAASYSRCHFSKVFKEQLGVCFVGYLSRLRVRRAAELLARTDMPVTSIALEVGFNDLSHFERVFRAIHRQPPSKFRAKSKELPGREKKPPSFSPLAVTS
jgi:AraC-like DNA-binding protein